MDDRRIETNQPERRRNRLVFFLLMMLPGFMFVGMLAPAAIRVKPVETSEARALPVTFENFRYAKRPMLGRNEVGASTAVPVAGVEMLFSGARYVAQKVEQAFRLPRFQSEPDDDIVLDDQDGVEEFVTEELLGEPEEPQLAVDLTPLWDPGLFDIIPPMLMRWGSSQFDDLVGEPVLVIKSPPPAPVVIPEPGTLLLVGLGLAGLGLRRSAARR